MPTKLRVRHRYTLAAAQVAEIVDKLPGVIGVSPGNIVSPGKVRYENEEISHLAIEVEIGEFLYGKKVVGFILTVSQPSRSTQEVKVIVWKKNLAATGTIIKEALRKKKIRVKDALTIVH